MNRPVLRLLTVLLMIGAGIGLALAQQKQSEAQGSPVAIEQLAWLAGHWGGEQGGRSVEEIWTDSAGRVMFGISRTIAGGKLREFEFLRIAEHDGRLAR